MENQTKTIKTYVNECWDQSIVPALTDFIKIPNKSPAFDPNWQQRGFMNQAVELIRGWCETHTPKGMNLKAIQSENRTPLILMDIPGQKDDTVLLYGHLDKQPEMEGWDEDLGPWKPVLKNNKLYGRGGADDGYAAFAAVTAVNALQKHNIPHSRCVILIEASEESGSCDLPYYINKLNQEIGSPSLVICLDSGCGNYDQLWNTTSLRGVMNGKLSVEILKEGVHSGNASGIVPSSFRIMRQLLDRLDDPHTGEIVLDALKKPIPEIRQQQANAAADVLGKTVYSEFPFVEGAKPTSDDLTQLILNRTWRVTLSVTGMDNIPTIENAGNVLRPKTQLKLSFRLPPTCNVEQANAVVKKTLETNPPYGAKVDYETLELGPGWHAPALDPWLEQACDEASLEFFGRRSCYMGEGGSIPFMGMLGEKFPQAQFLITGLLGPHSNAHGPNEFLHIDTAKNLTACVAHVLAKHCER